MSGGGGAMADAFINLGDLLHKNFSSNMNSAFQNRQARNSLAENKRQFDLGMLLKNREMEQGKDQFDRSSGMNTIAMLAQQRKNFIPDIQSRILKDTYFKG
jgi:hypothetical protein